MSRKRPPSNLPPITAAPPPDAQRRIAKFLASVSLFDQVPTEIIERLAAKSSTIQTYTGETLIEEGEEGREILIVMSGRVFVKLACINPNVEIGINKLGTGEVCGEMALLGEEARSATVIADEPGTIIRLPKSAFEELAESDPKVAYQIMRNISWILSRRLQQMNRRIMNLMRWRYA